ncbi:MAG: hypothetical protein KC983_06300 [Phycisphaerales bacterium]|nr:hypothetical protein [Phycisphaerales bacterium]
MRIDLRDISRKRIGRITVDPTLRPTRVTVVDADREIFLNWESALDDSEQLRRCLVCGGTDLFRDKVFPAATAIVVILAFVGAAVGVLGLATRPLVLAALVAVLVIDVAILVFSRSRLVCYRCGSSFTGVRIASYHNRWDRSVADRYPRPKDADGATPETRTRTSGDVPA